MRVQTPYTIKHVDSPPHLCEPAVMKTTFDSKEIAHTWAHQLAPRGTCAQSKSFDGVHFYSYGAEIGRIITRNGKRAYLLNITSYSVTTSKHQNDMRAAIPDAPIFRIAGDLDKATGPALFDYAMRQSANAAAKVARARNKDACMSSQAYWLEQALEVNSFFNLKRKVDAFVLGKLTKRIKVERDRQVKAQAERQVKIDAENAVYIERWLAGEMVNFPSSTNRVCMRLIALDVDGARLPLGDARTWTSQVETSRGVKIPVMDAERGFRFAVARRSKGWQRNGDQF